MTHRALRLMLFFPLLPNAHKAVYDTRHTTHSHTAKPRPAPLASRADSDLASPVYPPRAALSARARHYICGRQTVTRGLAERGCGRGVGRRRRCRRGRVDGRALAASLDEGGGLDALCGVDDGGGRWHLRLCFRLCLAFALALAVIQPNVVVHQDDFLFGAVPARIPWIRRTQFTIRLVSIVT